MSRALAHHPHCDAGHHDGLCSETNEDGVTQVFGVTCDDLASYVEIGTHQSWDGKRESADNPTFENPDPHIAAVERERAKHDRDAAELAAAELAARK